MINLNLEEIKNTLDFSMSTMYHLDSQYTWTLFKDKTEDKKYINNLVFRAPVPSKIVERYCYDDTPFLSSGCFGRFTYSEVSHTKPMTDMCLVFSLKMHRKLEQTIRGARNNFCWFTEEQISGWLDLCKEETGIKFGYKIDVKKDLYTVTFDFKELDMLRMKTVIFWTRYLYEMPSSLYVLDALILKEKYFRDESVLNLLNLVAFTNSGNSFRMSDSQCITSKGKFLTRNEWIEKLNSGTYTYLSGIVTLDSKYYYYISKGTPSNGVDIRLYRDGDSSKLEHTIEPFITHENLDMIQTSTGSKHYSFNPVKHWISREDRFERYIPVYEFLKRIQNS